RRWRGELVGLELRFSRGLEAKAVAELFTGLGGLVAPWSKRQTAVRAIVIEIVSREQGISYRLMVPRSLLDIVRAQLRAALPGVSAVESPVEDLHVSVAGELGLSTLVRPLRTEDPDAVT